MVSVKTGHLPNVRHITINTYEKKGVDKKLWKEKYLHPEKKYEFLQTHGSLCFLGKRSWIFQISLKEPWLLPKKNVNELRTLFGWLIFYFGWFN